MSILFPLEILQDLGISSKNLSIYCCFKNKSTFLFLFNQPTDSSQVFLLLSRRRWRDCVTCYTGASYWFVLSHNWSDCTSFDATSPEQCCFVALVFPHSHREPSLAVIFCYSENAVIWNTLWNHNHRRVTARCKQQQRYNQPPYNPFTQKAWEELNSVLELNFTSLVFVMAIVA